MAEELQGGYHESFQPSCLNMTVDCFMLLISMTRLSHMQTYLFPFSFIMT